MALRESAPLYELLQSNLAGNQQAAEPRRSSMNDVMDTVRDVLQLQAATAAIQATKQHTESTGPAEMGRALGLDLGGVTNAMMGVATSYKDLAVTEREGRMERDRAATDVTNQLMASKEQNLTMMLQMLAQQQASQMEALKAEIAAVRVQPVATDPLTQMTQQMTAQLLQQSLDRFQNPDQGQNQPAPPTNPIEQVVNTIASMERLKGVLGPALGLNPNTQPATDPSAIAAVGDRETLRILLEHEREKEKMSWEREAEVRRQEGQGHMRQVLQDLVPALLDTAKAFKGGQQTVVQQTNTSPGQHPHQCGSCGEIVYFTRPMNRFTCPACGIPNSTGVGGEEVIGGNRIPIGSSPMTQRGFDL